MLDVRYATYEVMEKGGGARERKIPYPGLLPPPGAVVEVCVRFGGRAMRFPVAGTAAHPQNYSINLGSC